MSECIAEIERTGGMAPRADTFVPDPGAALADALAAARPRVDAALLGARSVLAGVWVLASLLVLIPAAVLARPFDPRHRVYDRCARVWARSILLLMGIRVVCRLPGPLAADEPYVVAANHQGVLDIPALLVALPASVPVRFVAMRSLFSIPILGWGMRLFGHVPVDHRAAGRASASLGQAQDVLRRRWSVVFFPEGARTPDGEVGPFKKGAFHAAAGAGVRVLPVSIAGSWEALPRDRLLARRRGTIEVQVHAPLAVAGAAPEHLQVAAETCWHRIARALRTAGQEATA